jgi:hypothetical protein
MGGKYQEILDIEYKFTSQRPRRYWLLLDPITALLGHQGKYLEKPAPCTVRFQESAQHRPSFRERQISVLDFSQP